MIDSLESPAGQVVSRPVHRSRRQLSPQESSHIEASRETQKRSRSSQDDFAPGFLMGLNVAGVASVVLTTSFGLFHVDVFLRVYHLPITTFATGNFIFSFINTANDLLGAWFVDHTATKTSRSSLVGVSGCIFAVCFLAPFFRPAFISKWGGTHFVISMSLYDTMYSFMAILMGSVITDNHNMSDKDRVRFMASGKVLNLIVSFIVARVGLDLFDTSDLTGFRTFLLVLSIITCGMFVVSQRLMTPGGTVDWGRRKAPAADLPEDRPEKRKHSLQFNKVVRDFWTHSNFRAWVGMEMLLECQHNFVSSFLKTFVDRLLFDAGVNRDSCDWLLAVLPPLKQVAGIIFYVPIRRFGYKKVYTCVFVANFILSLLCLLFASPFRPYLILTYLAVHKIITGAVLSAGFHLAMSDMVLDMKRKHAQEDRLDEPSLAGLFMGANALLCKPMESFLPIVAAFFLKDVADFSSHKLPEDARWTLFYLLVVPPLAFSCLQLLSWSQYTLHPERTEQMRGELQRIHSRHEDDYPLMA